MQHWEPCERQSQAIYFYLGVLDNDPFVQQTLFATKALQRLRCNAI